MIVVHIELWPQGDESRKRMIGQAFIANDGTGTSERGNYRVWLKHAGVYWGKSGNYKTGRVENHLRRLSPYHLVLKALQNALFCKRDRE